MVWGCPKVGLQFPHLEEKKKQKKNNNYQVICFHLLDIRRKSLSHIFLRSFSSEGFSSWSWNMQIHDKSHTILPLAANNLKLKIKKKFIFKNWTSRKHCSSELFSKQSQRCWECIASPRTVILITTRVMKYRGSIKIVLNLNFKFIFWVDHY